MRRNFFISSALAAALGAAAFAQSAISGNAAQHAMDGSNWSNEISAVFFGDDGALRAPDEISADWEGLSEEDQATVMRDCEAMSADASDVGGAASGGMSDTATTGMAETEPDAAATGMADAEADTGAMADAEADTTGMADADAEADTGAMAGAETAETAETDDPAAATAGAAGDGGAASAVVTSDDPATEADAMMADASAMTEVCAMVEAM